MEKKEYPKEEDLAKAPPGPGPGSRFSRKIFAVIKFILGVCLLPFVYASSVSFIREFNLVEKPMQDYFWSGLIAFLAIYLFVWEPAIIYTKGQRLLTFIFNFFKPMVRVAPYLLPVYTIILFMLFGLASLLFKASALIIYFLFLFGFSIGLHLVFSAKSIRSRQEDFLKANYIFGFSFIYILNLFLLSFCLNLIFDKMSFVSFANNSFHTAKDIFFAVFRQLFL